MEHIQNSTREFINHLSHGNNSTSLETHDPKILANLSHSFQPTVIGQEFLHLGFENFTPQLLRLGRKLGAKQSIKIVWFGGSNTNGRTMYSFVNQSSHMLNTVYNPSSNSSGHVILNRGLGGASSCEFARGFKSESYNFDVDGADLVFLEFSVNDGVLTKNETTSCYESLIRRIHGASPNTLIVGLSIKHQEEQMRIIHYYDLPHIYLGEMSKQYRFIFKTEPSKDLLHLNDVGSFLVSQAISLLFLTAVELQNDGRAVEDVTSNDFPSRLFQEAENFDMIRKFNSDGGGIVIHNMQDLLALCSFDTIANKPVPRPTNVSDKCSSTLLNEMRSPNKDYETIIQCESCPKPDGNKVQEVGGGWLWCGSPWPAKCRSKGIHHHHCSNVENAGIFMQSFQIDNRPTKNWPRNQSRSISLMIRLLKGYDDDFDKSLVVVWLHEAVKPQTVATLIDTRWDTRATVLDDVQIASAYPMPSPAEHERVHFFVAIIPIGLSHRNATLLEQGQKCRFCAHSILGEFV